MKGIGNYKSSAISKFLELKRKNPNSEIHVYLCIDTDAFESVNKPFDKDNVKKALENKQAAKVYYIEAKRSIEDWFLEDVTSVCRYLKIPVKKNLSGKGQEDLKTMFKQAGRFYTKGTKAEGFIKELDIAKIMKKHCKEIQSMCRNAGFVCEKLCQVPKKTKE